MTFAGCGGEKEPATVDEAVDQAKSAMDMLSERADKNKADKQKQFDDNEVKLENAVLEIPDYGKVELKSYAIIDGMLDSRLITLKLDYTNNNPSQDYSYMYFSSRLSLYQDGVKLNGSMSSLDKEQGTSIKPGATIEVIASYEVRNETSAIEMECEGRDGVVTYTLPLS